MIIYERLISFFKRIIFGDCERKKSRYHYCMKGFFKPQNPKKYRGDSSNIVYRSSWEFKLMMRFDHDPNVIWWESEERFIPYKSPIDKKLHRYFVDFFCQIKDINGKLKTYAIEVKPFKDTKPPKKPNVINKSYKRDVITYSINEAKWNAAIEYCKDRNYEFCIMTENEIFGNK